MSFIITAKVYGDTDAFEKAAVNRAEEFTEISRRGKAAGAIHHRFGVGDGFILVLDEWDDPARMAALSGRLMAAVPLALAYRRNTAPGRTARFVLTGESGGAYTVPLHPGNPTGEPDVLVVADTIDLCRVAARRLRPEDLEAAIEGDRELASQVLAGLDAFARD